MERDPAAYGQSLRGRRLIMGIIFLVCWGLTTHGKYSATGDDPHYLMAARSIWADGDLDLRNNYDANDGALFGASGLIPELHARVARDGRLRPAHDVGVPFLLVPAFAVAQWIATVPSEALLKRFRMNRGLFAYSLISLFIIGIVVWSAGRTFSALSLSGLNARAAMLIVLVAWLSPPVLANSYAVFPEPFALLVTAWALSASIPVRPAWTRQDSTVVLMLGCLPWLHRKYAIYALALVAVIIWLRRRTLIARPFRALAFDVALFVAPQVLLAVWTWHYWGNVAGPLTLEGLPFSLTTFREGLIGTLIDRENGLLWWAPVYALLPAAFVLGGASAIVWLLPSAALLLPSAAHYQWWGGASPVLRFLLPLTPIFCLLGTHLVRRRVACWAALGLLVPQVVLAAYCWQHPRLTWPRGDGQNRALQAVMQPLGQDDQWLPSFRTGSPGRWSHAVAVIAIVGGLNAAVVMLSNRTRRQT